VKKISLIFTFLIFLSVIFFASTQEIHAQSNPIDFHRAKVTEITSETKIPNDNGDTFYAQTLKLERLDTKEFIDVQVGSSASPLSKNQLFEVGTTVIITKQEIRPGDSEYVIVDKYRLGAMASLAIGFFALVILIARRQGFFSIVGMFLSLIVLFAFIVPQIIAGQDPIIVSLLGSGAVAVLTIYLCHGFKLESHIALLSMFLSLVAVGVLSFTAVHAAHLAGLGNEEASYLQFGSTAKVNLQGLLLSGIMLGALGVLDDITLAQVSVVDQLHDSNPEMGFGELYSRALVVGKDHVASLVNTLILAYAASSLPLFLLFSIYNAQPAWVTLNSEVIAEEVVRTLTGSIGLVLAVPLTTLIATYFALRHPHKSTHSHKH
jgi:uncharacterized membrane protein